MIQNISEEQILFIVIKPIIRSSAICENTFQALMKICEKETSIRMYVKNETGHVLIIGKEEEELQRVVVCLRNDFNIELETVSKTQVLYRQTIKKAIMAEGKYIRQCGAESYGHCKMEIMPNKRGLGYEFENTVFDDNIIPKEYIQSINEGIQHAMKLGQWFEYLLTDIKVTLYDGTYHETDSRKESFKIAGMQAFLSGMKKAEIQLLEPIVKIYVEAKECTDEVIKLICSYNGKAEDNEDKYKVVYLPLREVVGKASIILKNLAKKALTKEISHYEEVPQKIKNGIIKDINLIFIIVNI